MAQPLNDNNKNQEEDQDLRSVLSAIPVSNSESYNQQPPFISLLKNDDQSDLNVGQSPCNKYQSDLYAGQSPCTKHQSDLHGARSLCTQHPNHAPFVPLPNLKEMQLREPFHQPGWRKLIELKAVDVVRLTVSRTSRSRPDQLGFKDAQGERYGTGTAFTYTVDKQVPCNCGVGASGHMRSLFQVMTVAHVVFDDEEALNTKVDFFYDSSDLSTIVAAHGVRVLQVDVVSNRSIIECWTHDLNLCGILKQALLDRNVLIERELQQDVGDAHIVVIFSHPHGKCKQVSFGYLKDTRTSGETRTTRDSLLLKECALIYDAPICPGAPGAPVNVMGGGYASAAFAPHGFSLGNSCHQSGLGWARIEWIDRDNIQNPISRD